MNLIVFISKYVRCVIIMSCIVYRWIVQLVQLEKYEDVKMAPVQETQSKPPKEVPAKLVDHPSLLGTLTPCDISIHLKSIFGSSGTSNRSMKLDYTYMDSMKSWYFCCITCSGWLVIYAVRMAIVGW